MEVKSGPLTFFSNFDSGNLAKVERVKREANGEAVVQGTNTTPQDQNYISGNNNDVPCSSLPSPDLEYNIWTTPDCSGSPYENLNRTWFYFGVKGCQAGKLVKLNLMNLNKQGKLYNQGMAPFVKVVPCRNKWERIRERPSYEIVDGHFQLSFAYRFPDHRNIVCYFAFCYPYSYEETQSYLQEIDTKLKHSSSEASSIYYHRELLCKSIDRLRVDLLTVTSCKGMLQDREPRLNGLFPDLDTERANQFKGKKIFVLTSRVHPGETPSSYVFKGFLDFITREDDPRASALRDRFVFKLVPLLNPDGVKRGHYRTDQRGVNLNRVYQEPSLDLHPSIYAVRALVAYYHGVSPTLDKEGIVKDILTNSVGKSGISVDQGSCSQSGEKTSDTELSVGEEGMGMEGCLPEEHQFPNKQDEPSVEKNSNQGSGSEGTEKHMEGCTEIRDRCLTIQEPVLALQREDTVETRIIDEDAQKLYGLGSSETTHNPKENISEENTPAYSHQGLSQVFMSECCAPEENNNVSKESASATVRSSDTSETSMSVILHGECVDEKDCESGGSTLGSKHEIITNGDINTELHESQEPKLPEPKQKLTSEIPPSESITECHSSGLGFYVDLHGHASKRGCFMYGNYMEDEDKYVQCLLYPKLISVNSAHFDFTACNFTEKNMYSRDRRDGMSKEGSGRVAIYKMTGLPHCYTLECNYNCGRSTNAIPQATCDSGCATPPPPPGFPPRYTTEIYEEVGCAVAISALDMVNANPWSRLPNSEHGCLEAMRNWVSRYIRNCNKNGPAIQKKIPKGATKPWGVLTNFVPAIHRPLNHKFGSANNDTNPQNGSDTSVSARTFEKAGTAKQRSSVQSLSNRKYPIIMNGTGRNQASLRAKDQGRKRLDVTKTAPLLMISNGDRNVNQVKLERYENRFDKHGPFVNFERQKSNVIKKLRDNLASMRMDNSIPDGNGNYDNEKTNKLRSVMSVRQLDCTSAAAHTDPKRDMVIESSTLSEDKVNESDKILKRPIISRRRRTKRTIQKESNRVTCEVVDVKSMPGSEVSTGNNSSQVSL